MRETTATTIHRERMKRSIENPKMMFYIVGWFDSEWRFLIMLGSWIKFTMPARAHKRVSHFSFSSRSKFVDRAAQGHKRKRTHIDETLCTMHDLYVHNCMHMCIMNKQFICAHKRKSWRRHMQKHTTTQPSLPTISTANPYQCVYELTAQSKLISVEWEKKS